ncbi:asparagine synthase-related protein [Rossellomorea vietnamensis]|uniref:asparagine synthase (glutamine-hydrolyzing) n=1 Tax=Rossellomorea vietnamensis TaxID=218284 RepID=A0A0P6WBK2_9BACI|nr:asparagine synthase-related protein [Rossellomorea vietnamensis]KPL58246.1 asparagine synthase [Rossellomorea vietnamensis]
MSAIAGIFNQNKEPVRIQDINMMMGTFEKFPANDIQFWSKDQVFLGCHAQWITPESVNEANPYYDYDRGLTITSDAIIDNRNELLDKLQICKSIRDITTDNQIILLCYEKWGDDCPKHLLGDFAFMIWDGRNHKMFGARDFSGSRTLYFNQSDHRFSFSTTIEGLLALPGIKKELNEQWLAEYIAITGLVDTANMNLSIIKGIEQLPPSHSITIKDGKVTLKQFCIIKPGKELKLKSNQEYVEAFQALFSESVRCRLRTYKNVGAQLSGGLDSGAIVGFAGKILKNENKTLHTFSYVPTKDFEDFTPKNIMPDESPLIKKTVDYVRGIEAHYLDFEGKNSFNEIDDLLDIIEMPYKYFENSFWLKGMFEKASEKNVGVLLNGGRGNLSISWGSALPHYADLLKRMKWIRLVKELNKYSRNKGGSRFRLIKPISKLAFPAFNNLSKSNQGYFIPNMINKDFAARLSVFENLKKYGIEDFGWVSSTNVYDNRKSHFEEIFHWNASNTLATKLSLRYGLWKRDPTNDLRIIRFCLSLPEEQYVQDGMDRALIRRATKHYLPDEVRLNQKVRGVQGADWLHRMNSSWNTFNGEIQKLNKNKKFLSLVDQEVIEDASKRIKKDLHPEDAGDPNYKVLMISLILNRYIQKFN